MASTATRHAVRSFRDLPLYAKGLAVVALPLAWVLVVAVAFYVVERETENAGSWVRHTQEVRSEIQLVRARVEEAETGALGYLLTRQAGWLAPYQRARQTLPEILDRLEQMAGDSAQQTARVRRMKALAGEELEDLRSPGEGANPAIEASNATLENLRQLLDDTMAQEDSLLAQRRGRADATRNASYAVIVAGVLLAPVCGVLAMLLFTSAVARRIEALEANSHRLAEGRPIMAMPSGNDEIGRLERSLSEAASLLASREAALRRSGEELEARVAERTSDLAAANRALEAEVAERNRAERQVADVNRQLEAVIDASPLAIMGVDPHGSVQEWNPAAERLFGWRKEELLGKPLPTIPDEDAEEFQTLLERTVRGEALAGYATRRRRKDGSMADIRLWTAPLFNSRGEARGGIALAADVTDQRRLEQQLAQAQKMEAVGRLAGGVAHDFNNVITVVSGYGHMLLEGVKNDHELHEAAEEVLKAANRAAALANQLLTFGRHQVVQTKALDINALVLDMERMLACAIGERIGFQTELRPGVKWVSADAGQIEQVLMNLVVNARDAMPDGGTLTVETANITLDGTHAQGDLAAGNYVMLAVSDTGTGMDAETRSHIFEPFFTTKERGKGTGLGLSIVYGIVKQHGGDIWVYSEPGRGTTFKIYLPQASSSTAADSGDAAPPRASGEETVLLVEDDPEVRKLARGILEQYGYRLIEAASGPEALAAEAGHEGRIDLLLTDVVLPEMSGREVAEALAVRRAGLKVLYLSGYTDRVAMERGALTPGARFLQKPFGPEALARKIREVLDDQWRAV